jgi:hypothetical protein
MDEYAVGFRIAGREATLDERFDDEDDARGVAGMLMENGVPYAYVVTEDE